MSFSALSTITSSTEATKLRDTFEALSRIIDKTCLEQNNKIGQLQAFKFIRTNEDLSLCKQAWKYLVNENSKVNLNAFKIFDSVFKGVGMQFLFDLELMQKDCQNFSEITEEKLSKKSVHLNEKLRITTTEVSTSKKPRIDDDLLAPTSSSSSSDLSYHSPATVWNIVRGGVDPRNFSEEPAWAESVIKLIPHEGKKQFLEFIGPTGDRILDIAIMRFPTLLKLLLELGDDPNQISLWAHPQLLKDSTFIRAFRRCASPESVAILLSANANLLYQNGIGETAIDVFLKLSRRGERGKIKSIAKILVDHINKLDRERLPQLALGLHKRVGVDSSIRKEFTKGLGEREVLKIVNEMANIDPETMAALVNLTL